MTETEQKAVLTVALLAAFADGENNDTERTAIKRIADSLLQEGAADLASLYQDVLLKRASLDSVAPALASADARRLAYEMAVCVCDADGLRGDAERAFLADLGGRLGLDAADNRAAATFAANADALAEAPLHENTTFEPAMRASSMSVTEQDQAILHYAILNGALEILPESLATMAIIPLQMKMVYRLGKTYGYELDRGHIRDFLATAGVGMASQYVEQIGVKLIGRVFGRGLVGGLLGGLAGQAVSSGFSFATTYALGQLARRYYAGGRTFSSAVLKDTYTALLGEARAMQGQYLPAIREKARTINVGQILQEVSQ